MAGFPPLVGNLPPLPTTAYENMSDENTNIENEGRDPNDQDGLEGTPYSEVVADEDEPELAQAGEELQRFMDERGMKGVAMLFADADLQQGSQTSTLVGVGMERVMIGALLTASGRTINEFARPEPDQLRSVLLTVLQSILDGVNEGLEEATGQSFPRMNAENQMIEILVDMLQDRQGEPIATHEFGDTTVRASVITLGAGKPPSDLLGSIAKTVTEAMDKARSDEAKKPEPREEER